MIESDKSNMILHASSIDVAGKGTLIVGKSGFGKSSLAIKLIALGADLVSDDQTLLKKIDKKIFLSKPKTTPNAIEARGLGLISIPPVKKSELFYFIELTSELSARLPPVYNNFCFGVPIRLIYFNPLNGNIEALFLMLKHGLIDSINLGK